MLDLLLLHVYVSGLVPRDSQLYAEPLQGGGSNVLSTPVTNLRFARPSGGACVHSQWRIQDFPEEGAPTPRGRQHTILPYFPKNCMKLKELGPGGGGEGGEGRH